MNDAKRLCLADFDDTLILTDSLKSIMRQEQWFMSPALFAAGVRLFICKRTGRRELDARNRFKKRMMLKYRDLPAAKKEQYYQELRGKINTSVITNIREKHFDRIAIVSASEEELIRQVLGDTLGEIEIIANIIPGTKSPSVQNGNISFQATEAKTQHNSGSAVDNEQFRTCYGPEKVRRLSEAIPDYTDYQITVYTDSYSDQPLIDIADEAYLVKGTATELIKGQHT